MFCLLAPAPLQRTPAPRSARPMTAGGEDGFVVAHIAHAHNMHDTTCPTPTIGMSAKPDQPWYTEPANTAGVPKT